MKAPPLNDEDLAEFLKEPLVAKLATNSLDGTPRITPLWFDYDRGIIYHTTSEPSEAVKNIRRNNKVSVLIDSVAFPYKGVIFKGNAEILDTNVKETNIRINTRYQGPEKAKEYVEYLSRFVKRVIVKVTPTKQITFDYTKM